MNRLMLVIECGVIDSSGAAASCACSPASGKCARIALPSELQCAGAVLPKRL
jgi:hypothetical protein